MKQSDNEKMRKFKNRCRNTFQRVRKFCRQHIFPVVLSACILCGVVFGLYYKVYATGITELYMTYWDLYNSIFASTGYSMKIKDGAEDYNNADRVTGKQAWHNFCEYVKIHASDVYTEAVALPKFVTAEGIKMSQDLWKAAQDYASRFTSSVVSYKSLQDVQNILSSATGINAKYFNGTCVGDIASGKNDLYCLNFIDNNGGGYDSYYIFGIPTGSTFVQFDWNYYGTRMRYILPDGTTESRQYDILNVFKASATDIRSNDYHDMSWTFRDYYKDCSINWVINGGVKVKDDDLPIITDPARQLPEKVREDEYIPWLTWADLDAKMREATDDNEDKGHKDDDGDKDKNGKSWKDIIPALIPFNPKTPSTTENDKNKDTEKNTESDSKKNPMINPDTGRYIDPDTGYDIDPDTGKLIDPDTGKLIDPNIPSIADKAGNWKRLFPFCIPWDMMELVKMMKVEKKAPHFTFKYTFEKINYTWVVDVNMADYWKYIKIFRWGMTIFFIIGLFFLTTKITTFVHRMGG